MDFEELYTLTGRYARQPNATARNKEAVIEAVRQLSYGLQQPAFRPWWRKREDTITPVAGTQTYTVPSTNGTFESLHRIWYRIGSDRHDIEIVDDDDWHELAEEDTTQTSAPDIVNLYRTGATGEASVSNLRFSPTPSSAFISQIANNTISLDGFIEDPLTTSSGNTLEPLMPAPRRWAIVWRAVEISAARQNDVNMLQYAAAQGKRYYEMLLADDIGRTGDKQRNLVPSERQQQRSFRGDYGRRRSLR